jgi:hypothetical protein
MMQALYGNVIAQAKQTSIGHRVIDRGNASRKTRQNELLQARLWVFAIQ